MNIGILFIGIGEKYFSLYHNFKKSFDKNFLTDHKKHYFIICDNEYGYDLHDDESRIIVKNEGWPYPIIKRFEYLLKCNTEDMDYLFIINGNSICQHKVNDNDVIPLREDDWLCASSQSFYMPENMRKKSHYIKEGIPFKFKGGFIGGRRKEFIELCEYCIEMLENDVKEYGKIKYYDDVYFNMYVKDKNIKCIKPEIFSYFNFRKNTPKIVTLNKERIFGKMFMRKLKGND